MENTRTGLVEKPAPFAYPDTAVTNKKSPNPKDQDIDKSL